MPRRPTAVTIDPPERRRLGIQLFNYTWTLLEQEDRSERESDRMIDAAHASRFCWEEVGEPVHHARGEWQISRAYAATGRAEPALHHAGRCLELCDAHGLGGFDLAYAYEALARGHGLAGDGAAAAACAAQAQRAARDIAETEDRELLLGDLATLPHLAPAPERQQ